MGTLFGSVPAGNVAMIVPSADSTAIALEKIVLGMAVVKEVFVVMVPLPVLMVLRGSILQEALMSSSVCNIAVINCCVPGINIITANL